MPGSLAFTGPAGHEQGTPPTPDCAITSADPCSNLRGFASLKCMPKPYREVPPALEGNDRLIAAVGAGVWTVALIVVLVLRQHLSPSNHWWIWTCVVGVGLGLFGVVYIPLLKRSRARGDRRPGLELLVV